MAKKKVVKKNGRPTKYLVEFNDQAEKISLLGATDEELGDFFNVDEATINRWKIKYPKFCASIKKGKQEADISVVESLYKRALGYEFEEEKIITEKSGHVSITQIEKHVSPDVTAIIFWLKNRQPDKWRDKKFIDQTNTEKQIFKIGDKEFEF